MNQTLTVVFVHPRAESFAAACLTSVVAGVEAGGLKAEVVDLYADEYRPGEPLSKEHKAVLDRAKTLVLVYPTWWTSQPAMLLGWLAAAREHGLKSVSTLACVTTHGGPLKGNLIAGQSGRHTAKRVVRSACAKNARFRWLAFYGMDADKLKKRVEFLAQVELFAKKLAVELHALQKS